jgi:HK97 gp10 family phage protein
VGDSKNLTGFKEFAAALKEMPKRVARKHLRGSVAKGATLIRTEARNLAPVDTGEMRKDIQVKRERSPDNVASYSVFVRSGKKSRLAGRARNVDKDSFYWRFLEFGTVKVAAQPFMRPAFEGKKEQAVDAIGEELDKRIQNEAADLARGQ